MPIEFTQLKNAPSPLDSCPKCGVEPFEPFMRGQVQRAERTLFSWPPFKWRPYCALICYGCKDIVGYEAPFDVSADASNPGTVYQIETGSRVENS